MIYSQKYVTRWHDTDSSRVLKPSRLLEYMQETSNSHMESAGLTLDELRDTKNLAFILSKIRLRIYAPLYAEEEITVETWTCQSRGFGCLRCYCIKRGEVIVAEADSVWALVDLKTGGLERIDVCGYTFVDDEPLEIDIPQRFRMPKEISDELKPVGERTIVYSDIDYNLHMNNTKYPDMLCDFIPFEKVGEIKGFLISYLGEATLGDKVTVSRAFDSGVYYFKTHNQNGKSCIEAEVILNEA